MLACEAVLACGEMELETVWQDGASYRGSFEDFKKTGRVPVEPVRQCGAHSDLW